MSENRIRKLRTKKGLTLKGLSEKLKEGGVNLSASSLIKYERNERTPSLENWVNLANFFGVSVDYLQGKSLSPYALAQNDNFTQFAYDYGLLADNVNLDKLTDKDKEKISNSIVSIKLLLATLIEDSTNEKLKSSVYKEYLNSVCKLLNCLLLPTTFDGSQKIKIMHNFEREISKFFKDLLNGENKELISDDNT